MSLLEFTISVSRKNDEESHIYASNQVYGIQKGNPFLHALSSLFVLQSSLIRPVYRLLFGTQINEEVLPETYDDESLVSLCSLT